MNKSAFTRKDDAITNIQQALFSPHIIYFELLTHQNYICLSFIQILTCVYYYELTNTYQQHTLLLCCESIYLHENKNASCHQNHSNPDHQSYYFNSYFSYTSVQQCKRGLRGRKLQLCPFKTSLQLYKTIKANIFKLRNQRLNSYFSTLQCHGTDWVGILL